MTVTTSFLGVYIIVFVSGVGFSRRPFCFNQAHQEVLAVCSSGLHASRQVEDDCAHWLLIFHVLLHVVWGAELLFSLCARNVLKPVRQLAAHDRYGWTFRLLVHRNNYPTESKLAARQHKEQGTCAYSCQCSWRNVKASETARVDAFVGDLNWVCKGHAPAAL